MPPMLAGNKPQMRSDHPSPFAAPTLATPKRPRGYRDNICTRFLLKTALRASERNKELAEAVTLRHIAKNTKVPVPKVHCAFKQENVTYILMNWVKGENIRDGWMTAPEAERESLLKQLKRYIQEFRNLPHPKPGAVAAVDMQSLYDFRIHRGMFVFGLFANESDFHRFERYGLQLDFDILDKEKTWIEAGEVDDLRRMIEIQDGKNRKVCFTHGDLHGANILVRKGKIVAIIDFELSGFYPEYWEYTTAMVGIHGEDFWRKEIPKFLDPYPEELEMESIRRKHFGREGYQNQFEWY